VSWIADLELRPDCERGGSPRGEAWPGQSGGGDRDERGQDRQSDRGSAAVQDGIHSLPWLQQAGEDAFAPWCTPFASVALLGPHVSAMAGAGRERALDPRRAVCGAKLVQEEVSCSKLAGGVSVPDEGVIRVQVYDCWRKRRGDGGTLLFTCIVWSPYRFSDSGSGLLMF
jgi:hypothetical protein